MSIIDEKKAYNCSECEKTVSVAAESAVPLCCGRAMTELLPGCVSTAHPEMVRNAADDEPCDDGRSGV